MQGVIIHVSIPKRSTACTTALKNIPNTLGFAPYLHKIINNHTDVFMILPSYFNDVTKFVDIT